MRVGNSSLGKGEVVSSILTGSTTKKPISQCFRTDLEWLHKELLEFERTLFGKPGLRRTFWGVSS